MSRSLGLYVHIPFCANRCDFCSFYLEVYHEGRAARFMEGLYAEIRSYAAQNVSGGDPFHTIYFGGGTPTVLGSRRIAEVLAEIRRAFPLTKDCEISVEAHPASVTETDLERLVVAGVNRISFGAESMDENELVRIGRPAAIGDTLQAVSSAKRAGFTNINLDLMYGLPWQTVEDWRSTLARALDLLPTHMSCYALTVEVGTRLAHNIARHSIPEPDESLQIAMDEAAHEVLIQAGFDRYEISNYARSGFACRHNLLYWTGGEYLGLGPSAQSYIAGVRFGNISELSSYEQILSTNTLPIEGLERLTQAEQLRDAVVFGLRLAHGVPKKAFNDHLEKWGLAGMEGDLYRRGLIEQHESRVKLTKSGRRYADTIAEKLF